jgi:hypothetical protein
MDFGSKYQFRMSSKTDQAREARTRRPKPPRKGPEVTVNMTTPRGRPPKPKQRKDEARRLRTKTTVTMKLTTLRE